MPLFVDTEYEPKVSHVTWSCLTCSEAGNTVKPHDGSTVLGKSVSTNLTHDAAHRTIAAAHTHCRNTGHPVKIETGQSGLLTGATQADVDARPKLEVFDFKKLQRKKLQAEIVRLAALFALGALIQWLVSELLRRGG